MHVEIQPGNSEVKLYVSVFLAVANGSHLLEIMLGRNTHELNRATVNSLFQPWKTPGRQIITLSTTTSASISCNFRSKHMKHLAHRDSLGWGKTQYKGALCPHYALCIWLCPVFCVQSIFSRTLKMKPRPCDSLLICLVRGRMPNCVLSFS